MRRRTTVIAAGALALAILLPGAAAATPPEPVSITGTFTSDAFMGTFYDASAPLCPAGTTEDTWGVAGGYQSGWQVQLLVVKEFTCADQSGTFTLRLQVHIRFVPEYSNRFTWTVVDGTGDYATLRGTGTGYAVPTATGGVDHYTGAMHLD
jgi:hypothetical protein